MVDVKVVQKVDELVDEKAVLSVEMMELKWEYSKVEQMVEWMVEMLE